MPKSFLSVKVGPPNNYRAAFVGRFDKNIFAFTKTFECCPLKRCCYQSGRQRRHRSCLADRPLPTRTFRQLSDTSFYAKVDKDLTSANQKTVKKTIQGLVDKQELPVTAKNLIVTTRRTSRIYFKPKIHKPNNPGRPIVSVCSCPTELICSYLDRIMVPIVKFLPSFIKDTNHTLEIFRDFNFSGENLFSLWTLLLYIPEFPDNEGHQALGFFFRPVHY